MVAKKIIVPSLLPIWDRFRKNNGVLQIIWIIALACIFAVKNIISVVIKLI